ncbi:MAG: hypothetical protein L6R37_002425 [Teloschistes peruensis]|nr:MAG: hypothetical protein L6R37_002425 [Teloschistes peruensis]
MPGEPIPTIFIRYLTDQAQFYSMTGEWIHRFSAFGGSFVIPRMFSPQELDPILPYLPSQEVDSKSLDKLQAISQDVPRDLAGALIEKLRGFQRACAEVHRQHLGRLVRMHSLVAYQSQTREMMLPEIASIVLQKPDPEELTEVMLWTTHAVLSRDMGFKRLNGMNHHIAPLWRVNSLHQMQKFEQVRNWVREYQEGVISQATALNDHGSPIDWQKYLMDVNPIPRFIQKTRRLIQDSRKHRSVVATSNIGPSRHKIAPKSLEHDAIVRETTLTKFNDMEKGIIGFLKSWCLTVEIQAGGDTWSLGPILLRAIGTYDGHELDARTAYLFLIEIGVCAPWDDRMCYDTNMHIPTSQDQKTKYLFDWAARRVTAIEHGSQPLQDSLASLRKDWANMAVYAIDSADAREIDDGISIEKIEGDESMFWVHVHIANPSAFVQPGDAVERYAARMISTVYTAETVYPMIDPRLSQAHFSLANNRPVLTVSIKLTVDGEIMERNLTPGWIHNLQRFTPTQVSQALGNDIDPPQAPSYVLKVGRSMGDTFNAADSTSLSSTAISDLRRLQQLGHARRIKRQGSIKSKINHLQGSLLVPDPHVYIQRGGLGPSYSPLHGRRFTGDPAISWEVKELSLDDQLTGVQHSLVSDMMMLACEAVGDWCSERNIPALYRGTEWNTTQPMLVEGYRAKFNAAVSVEHKFLYLRALSRSEGTATHKSMPVPHRLLGVPAYIQMTSPLRRYTDMLVHWQLQAALLHEASHGRDSLIGSRDDSYLPFSRARLDTLLPNISAHDRDVRRLSSRSKIHWILQLLSRAFYFKEAELPSTVDVFVLHDLSSTTKRNALGIVKQLNGYRTEVVHNDVAHREGGVKLGDWWQCRIQEVDTYQQHVLCLPIRLLKRDVPP